MNSVGVRLRALRESVGLAQKQIGALLGVAQSSINRYEAGQAEAPFHILLWYADYFDVSMDYIFGRCEAPQGKLYNYQPEALKEKWSERQDWQEFVEACFDPRSPMYAKLKDMLIGMMDGENK